jgi:hypothetical protein
MFICDGISGLLQKSKQECLDANCMLADKDNTEKIDNLIAQSLRALATPKMTSDEVKRKFSQDIQNANIAIMRLRQTKNDNAA